MDTSQVLTLLMQGNQLKRTIRTGWSQRGIVDVESVAAHSYGVTFIALTMAEIIDETLDIAKLLAMAVLHDLPEGLTTDIPSPVWRLFPEGTKNNVERSTMQAMLADVSVKQKIFAYWEELQQNESPEARLVHDCDKLDMYMQAYVYERQTGNLYLREFWTREHYFEFPETRAVFDELASLRLK